MTFVRKGSTELIDNLPDSAPEWKFRFFYAQLVMERDSWGVLDCASYYAGGIDVFFARSKEETGKEEASSEEGMFVSGGGAGERRGDEPSYDNNSFSGGSSRCCV
ncbi:hypothetical protein ACLOJK_038631 [Asimina triloba]